MGFFSRLAGLRAWVCKVCGTSNLDFMPTCRECDPNWGKR
jgi:hypothetical protein